MHDRIIQWLSAEVRILRRELQEVKLSATGHVRRDQGYDDTVLLLELPRTFSETIFPQVLNLDSMLS